jgi:hypothetical protein
MLSTTPESTVRSVRAGVFSSVTAADRAVHSLLAAGFTKEQITVICSDETKERHFREFEHQQPAGANTPAAAATGGAFGATLGGATALAMSVAAGGLPLVIFGATGLMAGGLVGGFLGAMLTRGVEKEAANFYDQAVQQGKLLVTVEQTVEQTNAADDPEAGPALAEAERVLADAGAEPLPLVEG